jgi:hypothetical protein
MLNNICSENCTINVEKCGTARQGTADNITLSMRTACHTTSGCDSLVWTRSSSLQESNSDKLYIQSITNSLLVPYLFDVI